MEIIKFWDVDTSDYVEVSEDNPLPVALSAGEVTTGSIQDGAVTDVKLANPKVNKAGDTMTAPLIFSDPNNRSKIILAKYPSGSSHNNAPTTFDLSSVYLHVGGVEYNTNSYRLIGFGYRRNEDTSHAAAVIGYQETNAGSEDCGRLLFATRSVTTNTAPNIRMTIEPNGQIVSEMGYSPSGDQSLSTKKYVDDYIKTKVAALTPIADPSTATTEDIATAYNTLLAALKV